LTTPAPPSLPPTPRGSSAALLRGLALFFALLVLLTAYFWVHRPFDIEPGFIPRGALRTVGTLLDALTVMAITLVAGGIGAALLRRFGLEALSRLERAALEVGIGLGVLALFGVVIGLIGLYRTEILWGGLGVLAIGLRRDLAGAARRWLDVARAVRVSTGWEALALAAVTLLLLLGLILAFAPPTHWDSLTYHLIAPTRALRDGRITAAPDNFYLGFSQNIEMLFGYAMALFGRDTAAAPMHFVIGLIALVGIAGCVRRHAGRWAGWTAALLLMSAYNVWALFGWAYIDLGTLLYGTLALIALTAWDADRRAGWIILMGLIAGFAAGVKYNAGAIGIVCGLFVLLREPHRVVRHGLLMSGAALIAFAPWFVKGLLLYGNPIYPFVFGGLEWDAGRTEAFSFPSFSLIGRGWLWHVPILPFAATVFGKDRIDGYGFTAGAWLLTSFAALPLVWHVLTPGERRFGRILAIVIGAYWAFWAVTALLSGVGLQTRLMMMALPVFAGAGALAFVGMWRLPEKPIQIAFIVRVLFILTLALMIIDTARAVVRERAADYLLGTITLEEYLYHNTGAYGGAMANLPAGAQVRFLYEPRGYSCPPSVTCYADMLFDHWLRPLLNGATPEAVYAAWRAAGDDYVLIGHALHSEYLAVSRDRALDDLLLATIDDHLVPVWTDGLRYTLYGWRDEE
jgi:hypothetical protein